MNALIISDLHLTERKQDEYRWKVFDLVADFAEQDHEFDAEDLYIMGDLFDRKDRHPSELINRLINKLVSCTIYYKQITILKGNHDYLRPDAPFLEFIKHLPNIQWIDQPLRQNKILWLPHSRNPEIEWKDLDFKDLDYVFMHQSVIGSQVSNLFEMNHGLNLNWLTSRTNTKIYSGDIHVPQKIDTLTYIGTQHPVSFGDDYQPRMLWLKGNEEISIPVDTIQRLVLKIQSSRDLEKLKNTKQLKEGDQIKVKVLLNNKELSKWTETKQLVKEWCSVNKIELFDVTLERTEVEVKEDQVVHKKFESVDPLTAFKNYAQSEQLDSFLTKTGQDLLNAALQQKGV